MEVFLSAVVVDTKRKQPLERGKKSRRACRRAQRRGRNMNGGKKASTTVQDGQGRAGQT